MNKESILLYGEEVFNGEKEKFLRWLLKTNIYLDNKTPNKMLETEDGIKKVKECLNRIEFGNFC